MRNIVQISGVVVLALTLAACGNGGSEPVGEATEEVLPTADAPVAAAADARPAAFAQCVACHSVEAGRNGIGPSLAGVFGAKAGHLGDAYRYSDALKASGLVWDAATLDTWLQGPTKQVPGTKMVYAGMPDAASRTEVIEYLRTLK